MSRVFNFIKRRPKTVAQVVRYKKTTGTDKSRDQIAEALAILEDANEHQAYRDLQARYNVPNDEILKAYQRLGLA